MDAGMGRMSEKDDRELLASKGSTRDLESSVTVNSSVRGL